MKTHTEQIEREFEGSRFYTVGVAKADRLSLTLPPMTISCLLAWEVI